MIAILRISLILAAVAAILPVSMYNLHMLQLNGYKTGEHINWLIKNIFRQWWLFLPVVSGICLFAAEGKAIFTEWNLKAACATSYIISFIVLLVIFLRYLDYRKKNTKKRLVYTARIKRLILTIILINIAAVILSGVFPGESKWIPAAAVLLVGICPMIIVAAGIINLPVERGINNYYINEAKAMLKSMENLVVIGITGSYGKTSIKFYLNTLLREHFNVLMTPESYNTPMGIVRTIREGLKSTHEIFLCEMGARHVGDISEVCKIADPTHGIIASIGPQHLETFFNIENIKKTKFELADYVSGRGKLFLNADNELIMEKAGEYENTVFYQTKGDTKGYMAENIKVSNRGTEFCVITPKGETESFNTKLIGEHNVINLVGAIAVANTLGISLRELKLPVRRIEPVPHRLQLIDKGTVTIIDDAFNSNPVGSKAALDTLKMFSGTRILITPGMVELGEMEDEYNRKLGVHAGVCCDHIILIGEKHTRPIYEGAVSSGFLEDRIKIFENIEDGIRYAYTIVDIGHKYILLENDLPDNY